MLKVPLATTFRDVPSDNASLQSWIWPKNVLGVFLRLHVTLVEVFLHQGLLKVKSAHLDLKGELSGRASNNPLIWWLSASMFSIGVEEKK